MTGWGSGCCKAKVRSAIFLTDRLLDDHAVVKLVDLKLFANRGGILRRWVECHASSTRSDQPRRKHREEARIRANVKKPLARLQLAAKRFLDCKFVMTKPIAIHVTMMAPPEQSRGMAAFDTDQG